MLQPNDPSPETRPVSRLDFEARLAELRSEIADPRAGLFGPGSKLWEVNRHSIVFLAAGRAGLLQAAHPYVAHGVDQHSISLTRPIERFNRTFRAVFAMVYGDLDGALAAARHTHRIHAGIEGRIAEDIGPFRSGDRYRANDPEALFWVHATLWDSSVRVFETCVRPLAPDEKEQYYRETRRFAALFGVPEGVIPATWSAFVDYNEQMWESDILAVGKPAATICRALLHPPNALLRAGTRWYECIIAGQLPPRLREQYGLRHDPSLYARSLRWLGAAERRLPRRLRYLPAYHAALRRLRRTSPPAPSATCTTRPDEAISG